MEMHLSLFQRDQETVNHIRVYVLNRYLVTIRLLHRRYRQNTLILCLMGALCYKLEGRGFEPDEVFFFQFT
jgi:hypothetical protein